MNNKNGESNNNVNSTPLKFDDLNQVQKRTRQMSEQKQQTAQENLDQFKEVKHMLNTFVRSKKLKENKLGQLYQDIRK